MNASATDVSVFKPSRWQRDFVVVSWAFCSLVIFLNESRTGDLSRWYTDHLHHPFATWVFLHKGLGVYLLPFGEAWQGVSYPQVMHAWEQNPMLYPLGMFLVFLPTSILGWLVPMPLATFGRINVLVMVALAHFALFVILRALGEQRPGARSVIVALVWMSLARLGMQGFYDSVWIAAGAWMLLSLSRGKPQVALLAFALAAFLHYRSVVLAPFGLVALFQCIRGKPWRSWPWGPITVAGMSVLLCVWTFSLAYPVTARFRATAVTLAKTRDPRFWMIVVLTILAVIAAARLADWVVAGTVAVIALIAVVDVNYWWHASAALFAPLSVDVVRQARQPSAIRAILLTWTFAIQPLAWRDHAGQVFIELAADFRVRRG